jgi:hypothetical protein
MSELELEPQSLSDAIGEVADYIVKIRRKAFAEIPPQVDSTDQFDVELDQFLTMLDLRIKGDQFPDQREPTTDSVVNADEKAMSDMGLQVIYTLSQWAQHLHLNDATEDLEIIVLSYALWCARNLGYVAVLDPVVDAVSSYANRQSDSHVMNALSGTISEIMDAVTPEIKADKDKDDTSRPWRLLNFNYGIVATRSLDPHIMEQAFDQLLQRFPEEAAVFFKEGVEQMDIVDYPDHVRSVMERYYQTTNNPTLH